MRKFKVSALIPQDQLGDVMGLVLERGFEILECSLLAEPSAEKGVGRRPKNKGGRPKGRGSRTSETAVLENMPAHPAQIHRKALQKLLPQLSANAIDGALSGLTEVGKVWRVSPGNYTLPRQDMMPGPRDIENEVPTDG